MSRFGDRVERARPGKADLGQHLADDSLRATRHFERRAPGKRQQQDPLRAHALQHEMRHPVRKRIGLPGAGAGDDQQGPGAERGRLALPLVQSARMPRSRPSATIGDSCTSIQSVIPCAFPASGGSA
jgi:hypothetical protein